MPSKQRLFTAYVDLPFLRKLLRSKPDPISDSDRGWMEIWQSVFSFLRRHARVIVDGKKEEVLESEVLTHVLLSDGQPENVEFEPGVSNQLDGGNSWLGEDPFSVFLFEECNRSLRDLRRETGLLFLCHDDLDNRWPPLFQPGVVDLHGDADFFRWKDLSKHARPLNSILVVDKYAYQQLTTQSKFARNIGGLLTALLPDHAPAHPIHIAIFTDLQEAIDDKGRKISDLYEVARRFIGDNLGHLEIQLRLLGLDKDDQNQHKDRFLFTNYGIFFSGDSFDYFDEDGLQTDTLVKYLPLKGHEDAALRRLEKFGKLNFSPPSGNDTDGSPLDLAEGDLRNRLLDWVQNRARRS